MSQRRRFYVALAWLVYIEHWIGLESIEGEFDRLRGEILHERLCQMIEECSCGRSRRFVVMATDRRHQRIIE